MSRSPAFTIPAALLAATLLLPTVGASQQEDHTVVRGNTLWDLAATVYGDPWQWPRIWEANRDRVADPNRIYPGQVLRIPGEGGAVSEVVVQPARAGADTVPEMAPAPAARGAAAPGGRAPDSAFALGRDAGFARADRLGGSAAFERSEVATPQAPQTLAVVPEGVIAGAPFLVPDGEQAPAVGRVADFVDKPSGSAFHAELYEPLLLEATSGGLGAGTRYQAYRLGPTIVGVGRVATPTGIVAVTGSDGGEPMGEPVELYGALRLGDLLRPLPPRGPARGVESMGASDGPEARIVGEAVPESLQTVGDHVFLDVGLGTTTIGDEFVALAPAGEGGPLGRLQVVHVQDGFATARVVNLVKPVFEPGRIVRMDRRMPAG